MAKILALRGKDNAVHTYRMARILESLSRHTVTITNRLGSKPQTLLETAEEMKALGDIWIVKYLPSDPDPNKNLINKILSARKFVGATLIVDVDDNIFAVGPDNPAYWYFRENYGAYDHLVRQADWVTTTNERLKSVLKEKNPKTCILPNVVDANDWKQKRKRHKKVKIGWVYSRSHRLDALPMVNDALEKLYKKHKDTIEIEILGGEENIFGGFPYKIIPGVPFSEYPKKLQELSWDIGIAPLADTPFNECKSNIKWLEGTMAGQAMVLSGVAPYADCVKHGKTGFLANSANQWQTHLNTLITNSVTRGKIVKEARKVVLEKFEISALKKSFDSFFKVVT